MQKRIKRILAALLALLLAGVLTSCTPLPQPESTAPSAPAVASAPQQAPSSTRPPAPQPEEPPASTPAPENTPPSGVLHASDEKVLSSVHIYHVADDVFNQPERVSYTVIDLDDLAAYHEFKDSYEQLAGEEVSSRIIFIPDTPVKDFRYLEIEPVFEDDFGITVGDTLYQLDVLTPEEPFVVNWISIGDVGMFRGFSFTEEDGTTRYFGFNISGYDSDMYIVEFLPN